jgi:hypothetical protein
MTLSIAIVLNAILAAGLGISWVWALLRARGSRKRAAASDFVPASWRREEELAGDGRLAELRAGPREREPAGR